MEVKNNIGIIVFFFLLFLVGCFEDGNKLKLEIDVEEIVITRESKSESITDKLIIDEVIRILTNAKKIEKKRENNAKSSLVRIQLLNSNPKSSAMYLLDRNSGDVTLLAMRKSPYFKIQELERVNKLLNLND